MAQPLIGKAFTVRAVFLSEAWSGHDEQAVGSPAVQMDNPTQAICQQIRYRAVQRCTWVGRLSQSTFADGGVHT